jgi:hypothetical protein
MRVFAQCAFYIQAGDDECYIIDPVDPSYVPRVWSMTASNVAQVSTIRMAGGKVFDIAEIFERPARKLNDGV